MANDEQVEKQIKDALESAKQPTPDISTPTPPSPDHVGPIMAQRIRHRACLFWFCIGFTVLAFLIVIAVLSAQVYFAGVREVAIFSDGSLQLIIGGMFIQILGLLFIITRALWNDRDYLAFLK